MRTAGRGIFPIGPIGFFGGVDAGRRYSVVEARGVGRVFTASADPNVSIIAGSGSRVNWDWVGGSRLRCCSPR